MIPKKKKKKFDIYLKEKSEKKRKKEMIIEKWKKKEKIDWMDCSAYAKYMYITVFEPLMDYKCGNLLNVGAHSSKQSKDFSRLH